MVPVPGTQKCKRRREPGRVSALSSSGGTRRRQEVAASVFVG